MLCWCILDELHVFYYDIVELHDCLILLEDVLVKDILVVVPGSIVSLVSG